MSEYQISSQTLSLAFSNLIRLGTTVAISVMLI